MLKGCNSRPGVQFPVAGDCVVKFTRPQQPQGLSESQCSPYCVATGAWGLFQQMNVSYGTPCPFPQDFLVPPTARPLSSLWGPEGVLAQGRLEVRSSFSDCQGQAWV